MIANAGDTATEEQEGAEETRTIRLVDLSRDNLADEIVEMEVDRANDNEHEEENSERTVARGKGRGKGRGGRDRDN